MIQLAEITRNHSQIPQWKTCSLCHTNAFCFQTTSVTKAWIKAGLGQQKCTWRCENCLPNS